MLAFYFRYNRFWLKVILLIILFITLSTGGLYAVLYRISGYDFLHKQAETLLHGTGRHAAFDAKIKRTLFPRPTIILNHFSLSESDGQTPAVRVQEVRIGLGWKSLLGNIQIEKLVLNDLAAVASRNSRGQWNIDDLLDNPTSHHVDFNRIQINNGQLMIQALNRQLELKNISYNQSHQETDHFPYVLRAIAVHPLWEKLEISARGTAVLDHNTFTLPDFLLQFDGIENKESFSGSLSGQLRFPNRILDAEQTKLIFRSNRFTSHTDLNIGRITQHNEHLQIHDVNSVFTGNDEQHRYSGTFAIKQAKLSIDELLIPEITADLAAQADGSESINLSMQSSAQWHTENGLTLPDFKINTRQDKIGGLPRFISEWNGSLEASELHHWQIKAEGSLDRHPATITLSRDNDNIDGEIELAKLNLGNYLDNFQQQTGNPYPTWLKDRLKTNLLIVVNAMNIPGLEIFNIRTVLKADETQAQFSPLIADLYSGHAEGSLTISNSQPAQYTLKQTAEDVQIRPLMQDLFRNGSLSGQGQAELNFTTTGTNRRELTENLSGSLNINVKNGYWHGINIRELMQAATAAADESEQTDNTLSLGETSDTKRATPFESFELKAKIQNGISKHRTEGRFTAPTVRMVGKGETNLYSGMMNDDISIYSNNGKDTLPLRLAGSMDNPSISLNYKKITSGLNTPKEKQKAVTGALKKQWEWIKEQSRKKQLEEEAASAAAEP